MGIRERWTPDVYLETTSACNLNCVMCPCQRPSVKRIKPDGFMSFSLFCNLVDQVSKQSPIPKLQLHKDGEPLLHPRIVEMIEYASARVPHVTLVTNAILLDEKTASSILATNLQEIRFSLEGSNNETYAKVRRQSPNNPHKQSGVRIDYDSVVENITRFCEMKKAKGLDTPRVGIRTTEFEPTRAEIDATVDFWKERADYVRVAPLLSWSGTVAVPKKSGPLRHPCMHLWETQVISSDGTAVPCCIYVDRIGTKRGHLADLNSGCLAESFVSPKMSELRRAHLEGNLEAFEFCDRCLDWDTGCRETERVWSKRFKRKMLTQVDSHSGSPPR